ncbi:hypothetical protein P5704_028040 (plasmid) [Pseudomonas sp. FeN3W]|nr:hypothetical protein P5704_028040 [Pseudomonas sp. FeN3W]
MTITRRQFIHYCYLAEQLNIENEKPMSAEQIMGFSKLMDEVLSHGLTLGELAAKAFGMQYYFSEDFKFLTGLKQKFESEAIFHDEFAEKLIISNGVPSKAVLDSLPPDAYYSNHSILRLLDGSFREDSVIEKLFGRYQTGQIIEQAIRVDDHQAITYLLEHKKFKNQFVGGRIERILKYVAVPPESKCYKALYPDAEKDTPFNYLQKLLKVGDNTSIDDLSCFYRPELAKAVGHEYVFHMLQRSVVDDIHRSIFKMMISDGADWYMGFKQAQLGHQAYLTLKNRTIDPVAEIQDVVKSMSSFWNYNPKRCSIGALIGGIDQELVAKGMRSASDAKKIYEFTGDRFYLDFCNQKQKKDYIISELSL